MMIEKDLYFLSHDGEVWAHWLSGRPSVKLGGVAEFLTAVEVYRKRSEDARKAAGEGASADPDPESESGQKVSIPRTQSHMKAGQIRPQIVTIRKMSKATKNSSTEAP